MTDIASITKPSARLTSTSITSSTEDNNESISIVLGAEKNRLTIQYKPAGITDQLFVSRYQLYLPDQSVLSREVYRIVEVHSKEENNHHNLFFFSLILCKLDVKT